MRGGRRLRIGLTYLALLSLACAEQSAPPPGSGGPGPDRQPAGGFSQTFTSTRDFQSGIYNGVSDVTDGTLRLQIGRAIFQTPYLWIPNSQDNSITLVDTVTRAVVGTYPLIDENGQTCYNPSRTTVDLNYDVWVGCRGFASYVHARNGASLYDIDNKVMKVSFRTGKVIRSVKVGNAPRALALDARNHLWVGASVDDEVWELDGDTGVCYRGRGCPNPAIQVADFPYGAAVDQNGAVWVTSVWGLRLTKIDSLSGAVLGAYGPFVRNWPQRPNCTGQYGIAIDQLGDVWLGGNECNDVVKVSGTTGAMIFANLAGGERARGVSVDLDGHVWVALSHTNTISKIHGTTGQVLRTVQVQGKPMGVAVDAYGHIWAVNYESSTVTTVNALEEKVSHTEVGRNPYTYSDMMGLSLRLVTLRSSAIGTWRRVVDGGAGARFTQVSWHAEVPAQTELRVRVRCADTQDALETAPYASELTEPGPIDCAGRFLDIEARFLSTSGSGASPVLADLSVTWSRG